MKKLLLLLLVFLFLISNIAYSFDFNCNGFCGIYAVDLGKDKELLNINAKKLFIPASVTKLYTLLGALELLGKDYVYHTEFYYFNNNLGVKTSGDPTIYPSLLRSIIKEVVRILHVKNIDWIYIDDTAFDRKEYFGKGWVWNNPNPIISASFLKLPSSAFSKEVNQYTAPKLFYKIIEEALKEEGISVKYGMKLRHISSKRYKPIFVHNSKSLYAILVDTIQASDNQSAEEIFRTLGYVFKGKGSTRNSTAAIIKIVKNITGYGINDFVITDGSGLSRYNLVSPLLTLKILRYLYGKYGKDLLGILSYSKGKGTLSSRFPFDFWGKTGTLTGVSALSGIFKSKKGSTIIISMFENNFLEAKFDPKEFENEVVTYIYKNY